MIQQLHQQHVHTRRVRILAQHLAKLIPQHAAVLDVGCGDGLLASLVQQLRPDLNISGIEVLVRNQTAIPIMPFDGEHIPSADHSVDVVMFVDVLHHTRDQMVLLREAKRVARQCILIKDHTCHPDPSRPKRTPFISGKNAYTPGTRATRLIDFGNKTCDFNATFTLKGQTYMITLK